MSAGSPVAAVFACAPGPPKALVRALDAAGIAIRANDAASVWIGLCDPGPDPSDAPVSADALRAALRRAVYAAQDDAARALAAMRRAAGGRIVVATPPRVGAGRSAAAGAMAAWTDTLRLERADLSVVRIEDVDLQGGDGWVDAVVHAARAPAPRPVIRLRRAAPLLRRGLRL